jgi:truncated hemoglobin YjbI
MPLHAHAREQGLNDAHFDGFLGHFREALNEVGVRLIRWRRSEGHQTS